MAKKQKRNVSHSSTAATTASLPKATATPSRYATSSSAEFNPDYTYVKKDLRRIAILASSFFLILVVLSFFLR